MPIAGEIRRLIEASTDEIFDAAVRNGMTTLRQDGLRLCLEGVSSLEEIRRVTGDRLDSAAAGSVQVLDPRLVVGASGP